MTEEKGIIRYVWPVIVILALVLIIEPLVFLSMSYRRVTFAEDYLLGMSGSSVTMERLEEEAAATFSFLTRWVFLNGILFGIFGLLCAWGIKRKESFAWKLGVVWGVLLMAFGIIIAVNELFVLGWSTVCPDVLLFLVAGLIALGCLLVVRKGFS